MWSVVGLWGLALLILVRIALECRIRLISGFHQMKNLTKKNHRSRHLPTMIVLGSGEAVCVNTCEQFIVLLAMMGRESTPDGHDFFNP